jgi:nucleoid DNA-binding protein
MTRKDLIAFAKQDLNLTNYAAATFIDKLFSYMTEGIKRDKNLAIKGWGILRKVLRKPRKARNPKTGEIVNVPAKMTVRFKASPSLKEQMR